MKKFIKLAVVVTALLFMTGMFTAEVKADEGAGAGQTVAGGNNAKTESVTVNKYSSKDDKIKYIMMESFKKCPVCKDLDEHQTHMVMDEEERQYLDNPNLYFEKKEKEEREALLVSYYNYMLALQAEAENDAEADSENDVEDVEDAAADEDESLATNKVVEADQSLATNKVVEADQSLAANVPADENQAIISYTYLDATANTNAADITNANGLTEAEIFYALENAELMAENAGTAVDDASEPAEKSNETSSNSKKKGSSLSEEEELELLYKLVESEAGIESARCREMVANVVINRVNSSKFPNTIYDVIYAPGAFTVTRSNAINSVKVTQATIDAVNRVYYGEVELNEDVFFFRNNHYFKWCKPVMAINHTYFSTYYK